MSSLSLRLPNSLHEKLRELARRESISINQLVTLAAAEKVASLLTIEHLQARAAKADLGALDRILARVPAIPPESSDARSGAYGGASRAPGPPAPEPREPSTPHRARPRRARPKGAKRKPS